MDFQRLSLDHREVIAPFFAGLLSRTCDLTPGTVLMWSEVNHTEFAVQNGALFLRYRFSDGRVYYALPLAKEQRLSTAELLLRHGREGCTFVGVPEEYLPLFEGLGLSVEAEEKRDYFDYLYRAEDLKNPIGKQYAKKRNLISQFDRAYPDFRFVSIGETERREAIAFFRRLLERIGASASHVEELERQGTLTVLGDPALCGMQGGALYVGGQMVGFSLGEVIGDTLYTHIEKADVTYKGAYQKLTSLFAQRFATEKVAFINREDDSGDEGLRRAKLSYFPCALLKKYTVTIKK